MRVEKKEVRKEMTSRLPWVAAVLIIVAAVGAWAIYGGTPAAQPTPTPTPTPGKAATISVGGSNVVFTGAIPAESGIENIYIMRHKVSGEEDGYDNTENLGGTTIHENMIQSDNATPAVLQASAYSVEIPYDNYFDIIVAFKIHSSQCNDVTQLDNFYIAMNASGAITIDNENSSSTTMFSVDNSTDAGATWGRFNAVYNNGGVGYSLSVGSNFSIDNVMLWAVKP